MSLPRVPHSAWMSWWLCSNPRDISQCSLKGKSVKLSQYKITPCHKYKTCLINFKIDQLIYLDESLGLMLYEVVLNN